MKRLIVLAACVLTLCTLSTAVYAGTADVDVYVTPGNVTTTLTASATYYNFGTIDLTASTNSVTGITLDNDGNVGVTLQKTITAIDGGGAIVLTNGTPSAINEFRIRCVEKATRATLDTDYSVVHTTFSTTLSAYTDLTDTTGTQSDLNADGQAGQTCEVWFQIDMPSSVDNQDQRKFDVTFQSTAQ